MLDGYLLPIMDINNIFIKLNGGLIRVKDIEEFR